MTTPPSAEQPIRVDDAPRSAGSGVLHEIPESKVFRRQAVPGKPFAVRGHIITPQEEIVDGYVTVENGEIKELGTTRPATKVVECESGYVVLPGMIDLHGHPEYNVFAPWEPPRLYDNRYQWRASNEYSVVIKDPWKRLTQVEANKKLLARYAEIRALVGGVTAIQGASEDYPSGALVRNVDLRVFGKHIARSWVDPFRIDDTTVAITLKDIAEGKVKALYMHMAEGVDDASKDEFYSAQDRGMITPASILIHGTALKDKEMEKIREVGAKLVWSPESNLRLYGKTTPIAAALRRGILVGIGADWLPSGSPTLLGELRVARRVLHNQGYEIDARKLVRMVTSEAAAIAGLGDMLGTIAPERPADLVVLEARQRDPWENVLAADPSWVELVIIGGDVVYGSKNVLTDLVEETKYEDVIAWGKAMLIDTGYLEAPSEPGPRLEELRAKLIELYPQVGPIFV
jgi:hypothetical protein